MERTLVGFKRFKSKKGNPVCLAIIASQFTARDNERGSYGTDMESVFLPQEQYDYLVVDDIGKPVTTQYDIVGGRAYLCELVVDRSAPVKVK